MKTLFLGLCLTISAFSGEYAVLATGYRLYIDRHEIDGETVRLFQKDNGFTEMAASLVTGFEREPDPPVAPAPEVKTPTPEPSPRELVDAAAKRHGLPANFVHSVVAAESAYKPDAVSPKGAIGLMQLMPATAQAYGADPRNPAQNVEAGTALLRELLIKYNGDPRRALAAYNAGPGAVERYNGVPPYRETQTYIERVLRKYNKAEGTQ